MEFKFKPIATLHTCFKEKFGIPRQMNLAQDAPATLVFYPEFARQEALRELEGFSHIWLIFVFHKAVTSDWPAMVRPPRLGGNKKVGVFASRSPFRPNPIGMSAVRLESIEITGQGPVLHLKGVDILDNTPVLDIKPYLPYSDIIQNARSGFAPEPPLAKFNIKFSPKAHNQCMIIEQEIPDLKKIITQVLENDPRPGYYADNKDKRSRVFGICLFDFDIKWVVKDTNILVLSLDDVCLNTDSGSAAIQPANSLQLS